MTRNRLTDQKYLLAEQFKDDSNLQARITLHKRFSINGYDWMRWVFDQIQGILSGGRILELGCGPGELWRKNASRIPVGWRLTLSDLSPDMLSKAKENLSALAIQPRFEVIDAQAIPFEDDHFEAVIANNVLFFVPDRPKALSEIRRVLKPGGHLFATTVGSNYMRELTALIQEFDPETNIKRSSDEFGLENGLGQLRPFFRDIALHRYPDALEVTEVEPLLAAVLSKEDSQKIRREPSGFAQLIRREINKKGAFRITKEVGMFVATGGGEKHFMEKQAS